MFVEAHPDYPELRTDLKYLGYWRIMDLRYTRDTWPHPKDHVDESWSAVERSFVAKHLQGGETLYTWLGSSTCRFCDIRPNGHRCLTDGKYAWPEGFAHYVELHGVRPPDEFVEHVLSGRGKVALAIEASRRETNGDGHLTCWKCRNVKLGRQFERRCLVDQDKYVYAAAFDELKPGNDFGHKPGRTVADDCPDYVQS